MRSAARIFSELGYRHATLEDVATALNIKRPALYHYAGSKEALLAECAGIAQGLLRAALDSARTEATGLEQLRSFFRSYAEVICDDFGRCFVLTDRRELVGANAELTLQHHHELSNAVREMIVAGMQDGTLKAMEPGDATHALFGAFNGIPRWYRPDGRRTPRQIADAILAVLFTGMATMNRV